MDVALRDSIEIFRVMTNKINDIENVATRSYFGLANVVI